MLTLNEKKQASYLSSNREEQELTFIKSDTSFFKFTLSFFAIAVSKMKFFITSFFS